MPDYQKMYYRLFNKLTDILEYIEKGDYAKAETAIVNAQAATEEMYIQDGEESLV